MRWLILLIAFEAWCCTGLRLTAKDGSIVSGRTLEFDIDLEITAAVVPRGYAFNATTPSGPGLSYKAKYAAVGSIAFNIPCILDGLNEKGLAVGTFYFPGFAKYAKSSPDNQSIALSPIDFPNWIITQFATVAEVKAALSSIALIDLPIKKWGNSSPPFHYIVYDKAGGCLVIEPIDEKLVATDNPFGIFTNSPTFDWHTTNLRNYVNLTSINASAIKLFGVTLAPFGQGSGMLGLPGDFTPPSRFVRAAAFAYTAIPSNTASESVLQLFHILNQFDIPIGSVRSKEHSELTSVTCVKDPVNLKYYFKTYDDQSIRMIDLNRFDLNAKTIKKMSTASSQPIIDISKRLK